MGKALLASFILFRSEFKDAFWLWDERNLSLFFIYAVMVFFGQLVAIGIYIFSNGNPQRKKLVKTIIYVSIGILLLYVLWINNREQISFLQAAYRLIEEPWFAYFPVAGWSMMFFQGIAEGILTYLVISLVLFGVFSLLIILLLTAGKADYYEDVLSITELRAELRKKAKEGRKISYSNSRNLRQKTRQVHVRSVGNGPWAFLWMGLVADKRINGSLVFHKKTLAVLILSIAGGIFLPGKSTFFFYSISGGIAYFAFLMSFHISMDYELKMKHIFVLPGQPWKKILAINIVSILKTCIYIITALLPIGIIFKVPAFSLLAGLVFPITMTILNLFSTVIIHQFIPSNFDLKAFFPIIRIFSFLLLLAPPAIAALWVGTITKSIPLGFYTISFLNLILSVLCLIISNKIFWRLEMR